MSEEYSIGAIAHIRTDFPTKFGIPRQSGIVDGLRARIVFEPGFANPDAVRGIEQFSHLWLIWRISAVPDGMHSLTVRPPRLGGNKKLGVFATRSPFRPNSLGLSSVKLERVEYSDTLGPVLTVSGADLMDMTPIIDIKPYLPYTDSHPDALCGFADEVRSYSLEVDFPESLLERLPEDKRGGALGMLAHDPRPQYHDDPDRLYGVLFAGYDIQFTVKDGVLAVRDVVPEGTGDVSP